jgi:hypothetical protein
MPDPANQASPSVRIPPSQLPYSPYFGPSNCNQYPLGSGLSRLCQNFGDRPNTNCARKCLQEKYPIAQFPPQCGQTPAFPSDPWYWRDHPICWYECQWGPFYPMVPSTQ